MEENESKGSHEKMKARVSVALEINEGKSKAKEFMKKVRATANAAAC